MGRVVTKSTQFGLDGGRAITSVSDTEILVVLPPLFSFT